MTRPVARVGVVGASGYGGGELVRLLDGHDGVRLVTVASSSRVGEPLSAVSPNLVGDRVLEAIAVDALGSLDVVLLATPHEASWDLAPALLARGARVIDLSAAYRLTAAATLEWYGVPHPSPELAADGARAAVYGLPELDRSRIPEAQLVANPGCYPTATLLALAPVLPMVRPGSVVVDAKSGTSGAGRSAAEHLSASSVLGDLVAYGAPRHRHTGEIETVLDRLGPRPIGPVSFTPHLVPMARGLLATCYASLDDGVDPRDAVAAVRARWEGEPFVHVVTDGTFPRTKALSGSNGCRIGVVADARTGRVVVMAAIDNLGKGAAGQAVQNLNLMLGLPETTGLTAVGVLP